MSIRYSPSTLIISLSNIKGCLLAFWFSVLIFNNRNNHLGFLSIPIFNYLYRKQKYKNVFPNRKQIENNVTIL